MDSAVSGTLKSSRHIRNKSFRIHNTTGKVLMVQKNKLLVIPGSRSSGYRWEQRPTMGPPTGRALLPPFTISISK